MTDFPAPDAEYLEPPTGLGERALTFWEDTADRFDLTPSEAEILVEVCRTLDDLDAMAQAVAEDGVRVLTAHGAPRSPRQRTTRRPGARVSRSPE